MKLIYSLLGRPGIYRLFGRLVSRNARAIHLGNYVRPVAGERVLDIGCGPGDVLAELPAVHYVGFDLNPDYIQAAQARFGNKGRFYCGDVASATVAKEAGTFDLVLATGVLHHLNDQEALQLLDLARQALRPGGRLVTYDGCFVPEQSRLARWVVSRDRGRFVRTREAFVALAAQRFRAVTPFVRHDLLRIPYTLLIMRCVKEGGDGGSAA